jgi:penicillin-binding protein 2
MRADRQEQDLKFTRRALLMSAGGALAFAGLGARLYTLQVLESERYRLLSDDNQFNFNLLPPSRGRILDRFGLPVADNRDSYRVLMVPEQTQDIEATLDQLSAYLPITPGRRRRILRDVDLNPRYRAVTIANDLDWSTFSRINIYAPNLAGVSPGVAEVRSYPYGEAYAHVIGYVRAADDEDILNNPPEAERLLLHPGFEIGETGIELSREDSLRGEAGSLKVEVNSLGRVIRELPEQSLTPTSGEDVVLTLDTDIQTYAHERLGDDSAAAVVMDVQTGEILALVSTPSIDSNRYIAGIPSDEFAALQADLREPFRFKAIQDPMPPGSTFKAVVAAAALEHGLVDPNEMIDCTGRVRLGNRDFHCWRRRGHGLVNLHEAIKTSCDIFFYEIAERLGIDRIHAMATRFGLGERFDIGIEGVRSGLMPSEPWLVSQHGLPWTTGHTYNTGIGQGFVEATPLQICVMAARIASGRAVEPTLYRNAMAPPSPHIELNDGVLDYVRHALRGVVHEPGGTSYSLGGLGIEGVEMAGKTGSSQTFSITAEEREAGVREQEDLPYRLRDHGLFMCYAPADNPKYAVTVIVKHGGGSTAAKYPGRDILRRVIARDPSSRPGVFARFNPNSGQG